MISPWTPGVIPQGGWLEGDEALQPNQGPFDWYASDIAAHFVATNTCYRPGDFTYQFNSHGFRCDEFIQSDADLRILFLGCSNTVGIGIPVEDCFAHRIVTALRARGLALPYWNAALAAHSTGYCARALYTLAPLLKPHLVVAFLPSAHRHEIGTDGPTVTGVDRFPFQNWRTMQTSQTAKLLLHYGDEQSEYEAAKNLAFMDMTSAVHGATFVWNSWDPEIYLRAVEGHEALRARRFTATLREVGWRARDTFHFGPQSHELMAQDLLAWLEPWIERIIGAT
jgi:hypothetical protein